MAIIDVNLTQGVAFSKNPVVVSVETDSYVEDAGLPCIVKINVPTGPLAGGETVTFVWDGNTVVLTVDSSSPTFPVDYGVKIDQSISLFGFSLRRTKLLTEDFLIYQIGDDTYLVARENGTAKELTVSTTDGSITITTDQVGVDPTVNSDLRIFGNLYVVPTGGVTETFHTKFDAIPDINNMAKIDLAERLHSMLECEDVNYVMETLAERNKSHKKYQLRLGETISPGVYECGTQYITRGGLKFQDDAVYADFFGTFFLVDQIYLTNKGDRRVHENQKESLAIICPAGAEDDATVNVTIFDVLGASYDFTLETAPLSRWRKYSFTCGARELDIINVAAANGLSTVAYWQVFLRSSDGGIDLGRGRNFYLVEKGALDRVFTFENTMGWFDTVTCSGETEAGFKVEKEEFEKLFPFWTTNGKSAKNIQQKTNFVANVNKSFSGYMTLQELYVWMEFLASENVWLQDENISTAFFNAVNIDSGTFKMWRDDDYRYAIEFEWSFAMRETAYSKVPFV
jgi:hypothetical protein